MKKKSLFVGVCFITIIIIVLLVGLPWMILGLGMGFSSLPQPEQTVGEFPYRLVYSIDGQQYIEEGIYVCEYVGRAMDEAHGKYRTWKGYIKGTDKSYLVLHKNEKIEVRCNIGEPEYYMNDTEHPNYRYIDMPVKPYLYQSPGNMPESILKSQYKIELIEWHLSDPIDNFFN